MAVFPTMTTNAARPVRYGEMTPIRTAIHTAAMGANMPLLSLDTTK
jgi:hypothetical protein